MRAKGQFVGKGKLEAYPADVFQAAATMAALAASSPLILKLRSKSKKREELLFFKSYALAWVTIVTADNHDK